ncbi:hypothetical protein ACFV9W_01730 [Streptomyces sp. NPDC059897]|uniref:hypothetical protein n=1 Tax=Streptomyces sp. NPDC059897 TaxID=3346994 RepID=UPI003663766D
MFAPWPSLLLPMLTLDDAHELMGLLADVRAGREPERELAACLLATDTARVSSREQR